MAQARVEGKYLLGNGAIILPSAELGHVRQITKGFRDSLGREVDGQTAMLTQLQLGTAFEIPVELAKGDLAFRPGLSFVVTDEDRGLYGESGLEDAGRIDFGVDCQLDGNISLEFDGFYSGLGQRDRESYGAGVDLRMDF